MLKVQNIRWFTLVELVVVATILVILTSIWFYSYVWNLQDSRDSARKADVAKLSSGLKLYKQKRWVFPRPWSSISLLHNTQAVASQGLMNESVPLSTLDQLVYDPKTKKPYHYSTTSTRQEFQIAWSLENADNPIAILKWDYSSVAKNILPTIMLATNSTTDLEIWGSSTNRNLFIFDWGRHNIPYDFVSETSQSNGTTFNSLINDPLIEFWQNSDYRTCGEIYESGKSIGTGEYQVLDNTGTLVSVNCSCTGTWCTNS